MTRHLAIGLGDIHVGSLWGDDQYSAFKLDVEYLDRQDRPVLGQYFEDRLRPVSRRHRGVHPWFENVLPEPRSAVRTRLITELGIGDHDDLGLLAALGEGLPGATVAHELGTPAPVSQEPDAREDCSLRMSLGGMQLKFSLSGTPDRLSLPVRGEPPHDAWILKIGSPAYPELAENEASILAWCRAAGFDVPDVRVLPRAAFPELGSLPDVPTGFLIRRYDRDGARRIHQEDLLQVLGRRPTDKYVATDAAGLASIAFQVLGREGLLEWLRRMAAVIATGNGDAHLKNWSLLYPDGVRARWAPLYDQVATIAYPGLKHALLRIGTARHVAQVGAEHLVAVAVRAGGEGVRADALEAVEATVVRMRAVFEPAALGMPTFVEASLREHWGAVPLLRAHGPL